MSMRVPKWIIETVAEYRELLDLQSYRIWVNRCSLKEAKKILADHGIEPKLNPYQLTVITDTKYLKAQIIIPDPLKNCAANREVLLHEVLHIFFDHHFSSRVKELIGDDDDVDLHNGLIRIEERGVELIINLINKFKGVE